MSANSRVDPPAYSEGFRLISCAAHPDDVARVCERYAQVSCPSTTRVRPHTRRALPL